MPRTDWERLFVRRFPESGATEAELNVLAGSVPMPLSPNEVLAINSSQINLFPPFDPRNAANNPFDARGWRMPTRPLPASYLDFLRWSNGGSFFNGNRRFDPFFPTKEVRGYLLSYHFPRYMPEAVPFAFDGDGNFWLFDMRQDKMRGEYPILFAACGNLCYEDAVLVATSFIDACGGTTDPTDLAQA